LQQLQQLAIALLPLHQSTDFSVAVYAACLELQACCWLANSYLFGTSFVPSRNFAKNGELFAVAQGVYAIFVDTIFVGNFSSHLRV
jgi:hypothetical protein